MFKKYALLFMAAILVVGFLLRFHKYTTWPREGATFDEYAWTWLGVNLLTTGDPISWSPHPQYQKRTHYVSPGGARFWLVEPYLEHPPVFGLLAGAYARVTGASDMYSVSFASMRQLALILGVASIAMVYLFAYRLYGVQVGLLASLLYAIIPTVVVGSRILQNENFFIPMFLGILLCVHTYLEKGKRRFLCLSAVLAGLAILAKVPWIAATVSSVGILLYRKKYHDAALFTGVVTGFFLLFIGYGFWWDQKLFLSLWRLQLARYDMTFNSIYALLTQPYLVDRYYVDGWIYAGWLAWFMLFVKDMKKHIYLCFGLLGYFLVYIAAIPNEPSHGWYRYPFYPFLVTALAVFARDYVHKFAVLSFVMLGVSVSLLSQTWAVVFGFSYPMYRGIILWFATGILPEFISSKRMAIFARRNVFAQFAILVFLSVWAVLLYNEQ